MPPEEIVTSTEEVVGGDSDEVEKTEESTEDPETETTEDSEEEEEETESDDSEIEQAKQLYNLLKDPRSARELITDLASKYGIIETKKDEKNAIKSIAETLSEHLGSDFKFLADKLAPAIEKIVQAERLESQRTIENLSRNQFAQEVNSAYNSLTRETKGDLKKYESRMEQLSKEIPVGTQPIRQYLKRLYTIAKSEVAVQNGRVDTAKKISSAGNDPTKRLKSAPQTGRDSSTPQRGNNETLGSIISGAMKKIGPPPKDF